MENIILPHQLLRVSATVAETDFSRSVPARATSKRSRRCKGFWTLDAETDPFSKLRNQRNEIPQPFKWGAYHLERDDYIEFNTPGEVVEFFRDKRELVYAHNGGKFDYHYLREDINSDDPLLIISGRLAKFKIGECEFRDSLNLLPVSLDSFGGKVKIDYSKFEPDRRCDPNIAAEISRYLKQDCVTLAENLQRYFDEYGKSITQASASMKYWEKNFNQTRPVQSKSDFERYQPFYYGGRVQCFAEGVKSESFTVVDKNSAYPDAMRYKHIFSTQGILRNHLPPGDQIYRCLIKLSCSARGCFPWRDPDGALYFPDDEGGHRKRVRDYFVTGWEFLSAVAGDHISHINIKEIHYFTEVVCFRDYIDSFYEKRLKAKAVGDKAQDVFCKLFMNSLYGRFGMNPDNHADYVIASDESMDGWLAKGFQHYKPWGDRFLMVKRVRDLDENDRRQQRCNIATAASITGFVRAGLFQSLDKCQGLVYCDTDSIAAKNVSALTIGNELGQWKEEMTCDEYAIGGKKLYAFRDVEANYVPEVAEKKGLVQEIPHWYKTACKGVDLTPGEIIRVAKGETIKYEPEVPTYSVTRNVPRYINRDVMRTYKDISNVN